MTRVTLELGCGERTCAKEVGKFCRYLTAKIDGSAPRCALFERYLFDEDGTIRGWLLRCQECLTAEKESDSEQLRDALRQIADAIGFDGALIPADIAGAVEYYTREMDTGW